VAAASAAVTSAEAAAAISVVAVEIPAAVGSPIARRRATGALLTVAMACLSSQTALAAYCGPPADTKVVETLAIGRPPHDRSRIMYLIVVDSFALAELEWKGEFGMYFAERNGRWAYSGALPPANVPASVKKRFDAVMNAYPHPCTNPHFVSHPSGP
jgi:hypothetical protein